MARFDRPFSEWLAEQVEAQDVVGKLARFAANDETFPEDGSYYEYQQYIRANASKAELLWLSTTWFYYRYPELREGKDD